MKVEVVGFIMTTRRGVDRLAQVLPQLSKRDSIRDFELKSQAAPDSIARGMDESKGQDVFLTRVKFTFTSRDEMTDQTISRWLLRFIDSAMQGLRVYDAQVAIKR